jgi:hypothetical protein
MREIQVKTTQRAIEPFWLKLPFLFRFPFRPAPLIFLGCLVAASALAGLVLGPFGLLFKGILIYFGLRYGFNVLDLFRKGRFEGESPDHSLWGAETRPGKLGVVIAIYVVIGVMLGNWAVSSRVAGHAPSQQIVLDAYKREHTSELAAHERERAEQRDELQKALRAASVPDADEDAADGDERAFLARDRTERRAEIAAELDALEKAEAAAGEYGRPRAEILREAEVKTGEALWFKLLPWWFWGVMALLSLMLPASTLVIAIDDELLRALNPTWVPYFLRAMGAAYLVLWLFFLAIVGSRQAVLAVGADWPTFVRLPVEMGLGGYLGLVLCALLGYVIYQYHQELHLEVDVDFETHRQAGGAENIARAGSAQQAVSQADPRTPLERRVQQLVAAGRISDAIAEVKDEMRYDRLDPDLNTQLHALYLRLGNREQTLTHGQTWLRALVRAERLAPALTSLRKLRTIDAGFLPHEPEVLAPLARSALEHHERELAAQLAQALLARWPQHAGADEARATLAAIERTASK